MVIGRLITARAPRPRLSLRYPRWRTAALARTKSRPDAERPLILPSAIGGFCLHRPESCGT